MIVIQQSFKSNNTIRRTIYVNALLFWGRTQLSQTLLGQEEILRSKSLGIRYYSMSKLDNHYLKGQMIAYFEIPRYMYTSLKYQQFQKIIKEKIIQSAIIILHGACMMYRFKVRYLKYLIRRLFFQLIYEDEKERLSQKDQLPSNHQRTQQKIEKPSKGALKYQSKNEENKG